MKVIFETERLIFREIAEADDSDMYELDADPEVQRYLGNKPITTLQEAQQNIAFIRNQYAENGIGRWAVVEKGTNSFIGWAGFKLIRVETNRRINYYDLGYRLMPRYWGKGYATEIAKSCVSYGFQTMKLGKITAIADANNRASQAVLEKAGFNLLEQFSYEGLPHFWFEIENNL
jgi:ribosomal-protein-alanine N-acetyltransferase